jgi:hypothetical protein
MKSHTRHLESLSQKFMRWTRNILASFAVLGAIVVCLLFRSDLFQIISSQLKLRLEGVLLPTRQQTDHNFAIPEGIPANQFLINQKDLYDFRLENSKDRISAVQGFLNTSKTKLTLLTDSNVAEGGFHNRTPFLSFQITPQLQDEKGTTRTMAVLLPGERLILKARFLQKLKPEITLRLRAMGVSADRQDLPVPVQILGLHSQFVEVNSRGNLSTIKLQWNAEKSFEIGFGQETAGMIVLESMDALDLADQPPLQHKVNWVTFLNLPSAHGEGSQKFFPKSYSALEKVQGVGRVGRLERLVPESNSSDDMMFQMVGKTREADLKEPSSALSFWGRWGKQTTAEFKFMTNSTKLGQAQWNQYQKESAEAPDFTEFSKNQADVKFALFDFSSWTLTPRLKSFKSLPFALGFSQIAYFLKNELFSELSIEDEKVLKVKILDDILAKVITNADRNSRWAILGIKESLPKDTVLKPDEPQSFAWISDPTWVQRDRSFVNILSLGALGSLFSNAENWTEQFLEDWFLTLRNEQNFAIRKDQKGMHFHFPRAYFQLESRNLQESFDWLTAQEKAVSEVKTSVPFADMQMVRKQVDTALENGSKTINFLWTALKSEGEHSITLLTNSGRELKNCKAYPERGATLKADTLVKKSTYETRIHFRAQSETTLLRCQYTSQKLSDDFELIAEEEGQQIPNDSIFFGPEAFSWDRTLSSQKNLTNQKEKFRWEWMMTAELPPKQTTYSPGSLYVWTELDLNDTSEVRGKP